MDQQLQKGNVFSESLINHSSGEVKWGMHVRMGHPWGACIAGVTISNGRCGQLS